MVYAIYIFLLVAIHVFLWRSKRNSLIFLSKQKAHWLVAGFSLFAVTSSLETGQLITGILQTQGMSGMWIIWSSSISVFVVPLVFAPLWAKLDFPTDNQFIRFRFSGKGATVLHVFRSLYVGVIVTSILISFHLLAFSRVLVVFCQVERSMAILLSGGFLLLFSFKNRLASKMYTDVLHASVYILALLIITWSVFESRTNWFMSLSSIQLQHPETLQIFPTKENNEGWMLLISYVGIQWWSAQLFDGGGPEMKRFAAVNTKWDAIKTALFPVLMNVLLLFLFLGMALLAVEQTQFTGEIEFLHFIYTKTAPSIQPLIVIGFFALFISASEGLLHWGGSFVTIDVFETYISKFQKAGVNFFIGLFAMLMLTVFAILIAYFSQSLFSLIKLMLSISAGVAPVYILRWIWLRINAWSQLSAMLTSGATTICVQSFLGKWSFSLQLIVITAITTCVWLLVTFLTPQDDESTLQRFKERIPAPQLLLNSIGISLLAGFGLLLLTISAVYLLFC